ncbi:MAG: DUF2007 domain-containing protein [Anaerolineaceae bacterium]|nr:DUF2007 domain-containing protein [Anaerolineaceae bacterium]
MNKQVVIYNAAGQLQADMIIAFLKSKDINCFSSMESAGAIYGLQGGVLGNAKIYVLEKDQEEAKLLLQQMEDGEFVLPDDVNLSDYLEDGDESKEEK